MTRIFLTKGQEFLQQHQKKNSRTEGSKTEGNCASDPLLTEQLAQETLIASHWSLLAHVRIDFHHASSFVTVLSVPYHMS